MALPSFIRNASARVVALSALAVATVAVPATLLAWGPERPTYTVNHPADHVTFNSITDNPNIGDERNFVGIRENGTTGKWQDTQTVTPGKEYVVRLYIHNNAAENLKLVANNVTAKVNLPTVTAKSIEVQGFINSTNASPKEVYDHATFNAAENFNLAVVPGSMKYYNNANGNGFSLPETLFTSTGAKLGYDKMDGNIPGCFQYAGYLTFIVKPQFAAKQDFTMNKLVSKHGENKWVDNYAAKPGETVDYLLEYKNTGNAQQDNVTFRDTLPADQTYVAGSTVFGNSKFPNGNKATDDITGVGVNVGSYAAGANAWLLFSAKVAANGDLDKCGPNTMTNTAKVSAAGTSKSDTAVVTVNKECVQEVKEVEVCRLSDKKIVKISETEYNANKAKYSTNLDDCKVTPTPVEVEVCRLSDKKIVTVSDAEYTANKDKYSKTLDDCKETTPETIKVCRLEDKKIVTIDMNDFDDAIYSKVLDKCKTPEVPVTPTTPETPETPETPVTPVETEVPENPATPETPVTPENPETPVELPQTGIADGIMSVLGVSSLVAASSYYRASRKSLQN